MAGCDPQTARFAPIPENLAPARSFIRNYVPVSYTHLTLPTILLV